MKEQLNILTDKKSNHPSLFQIEPAVKKVLFRFFNLSKPQVMYKWNFPEWEDIHGATFCREQGKFLKEGYSFPKVIQNEMKKKPRMK